VDTAVGTAFFRTWIMGIARLVEENVDRLTRLDAAIGDGDHGVNLRRGFQAAVAELERRRMDGPGVVLIAVGRALISTTGGASGPLYGSAFRAAGKALGTDQRIGPVELGQALADALAAVQKLGGAAEGDKTMVDALTPAISAYDQALVSGAGLVEATRAAVDAAQAGAQATVLLQARKGRASYLGPRSVGHEDPGAASTVLILRALHLAAWGSEA
jgi:phosphoenolpyruvate---glycerone phosphotransferase subunit DhaL